MKFRKRTTKICWPETKSNDNILATFMCLFSFNCSGMNVFKNTNVLSKEISTTHIKWYAEERITNQTEEIERKWNKRWELCGKEEKANRRDEKPKIQFRGNVMQQHEKQQKSMHTHIYMHSCINKYTQMHAIFEC